ncbi:MAG: hypothetical protein HXY50_04620 [Ignavibacteriaceae bacterium]|nr:hypothetical protein [Ignavibacteriaceae bacterium]
MKIQTLIGTLSAVVLFVAFYASSLLAQEEPNKVKNQYKTQLNGIKHGAGFVDLNGDGFNDNAPDIDGDGIPNGQDPDYVRSQNGTGQKKMYGRNLQTTFGGNKYGPGNGKGNSGIGPKDGTGNGSGNGTGSCDGTGPKGNRGGRR